MIITRQPHDLGHPVGVFSVKVDPQMLDEMGSVLTRTKWADLPELKGGDVSGASLSIEYARGRQIVQRHFNSWNRDFIVALKPVVAQLDSLQELLMKSPVRAIKLSVARSKTGFAITWLNIGNGDVVIADPRTPRDQKSSMSRAFISVYAPPKSEWALQTPPTIIGLAPASGALKPVTLAPGKPFTLDSVAWPLPAAPGEYSIDAGWIDYDGADMPVDAVLPAVPDPDHLNDKRPYVFRGGVFSGGGLYVTVEKPR